MIVFINGGDGYRRREKLDEIRGNHPEKKESVLEMSFDLLVKDEFRNFETCVKNVSLFHPFRRIILNNVFACEEEKALISLLKSLINDTTLMCVVSEERAPRKAFAFLKEKPVRSYIIKDLSPIEFRARLQKEAEARGITLTNNDIQYLALNYASDMWGAMTELDALSLEKKRSAREAPHDLLRADFFALIGMLRSHPREALPALEILLSRDDPARVFHMMAYNARGEEKIRYADYDIAVKSGKLDYEVVLVDAVLCA